MSPRLLVPLALATVYLVWSSTYLALHWVVAELPPLTAAGLRFVLAGLVLVAVARLRSGRLPDLRTAAWAAPLGILVFAVGNGFVAIAQRSVPSGTAAVACAAVPCFATAIEALFGTPTSRRQIAGVVLGLAGVVVLDLDALGAGLAGPGLGAPGLLLVLAPLGWALGSVLAKRKLGGDPFGAAGVQMMGGGLAALALGAALGEVWPEVVSAKAIAAWVYLLVVGSLVAFSAYVYLLFRTPVGVATSYAFVNPVVALGLGWAIEGETLGPTTPIAAALVLAGLALVLARRGPSLSRASSGTCIHPDASAGSPGGSPRPA